MKPQFHYLDDVRVADEESFYFGCIGRVLDAEFYSPNAVQREGECQRYKVQLELGTLTTFTAEQLELIPTDAERQLRRIKAELEALRKAFSL